MKMKLKLEESRHGYEHQKDEGISGWDTLKDVPFAGDTAQSSSYEDTIAHMETVASFGRHNKEKEHRNNTDDLGKMSLEDLSKTF